MKKCRVINVNLLVEHDGWQDAASVLLTEQMQKYGNPESCLIDWSMRGNAPVAIPEDYEPDEHPVPQECTEET